MLDNDKSSVSVESTLNLMSVSCSWLNRVQLSHLFERSWQRSIARLLILVVTLACLTLTAAPAAWAGLNDDHYDGNIFPIYAGDGSLVPPKVTLAASINSDRPTLLVLYIDDSSDCKRYAPVVSRLSAYYGRAADFMPISIDRIPVKASYESTEPGYYYKGVVPQTVLLDQSGNVVLDAQGVIPFEQVDDKFRDVFDLLPRSESVELRRRSVNEITGEVAQ
jgi:hypothetical protein